MSLLLFRNLLQQTLKRKIESIVGKLLVIPIGWVNSYENHRVLSSVSLLHFLLSNVQQLVVQLPCGFWLKLTLVGWCSVSRCWLFAIGSTMEVRWVLPPGRRHYKRPGAGRHLLNGVSDPTPQRQRSFVKQMLKTQPKLGSIFSWCLQVSTPMDIYQKWSKILPCNPLFKWNLKMDIVKRRV